MTEKISRLRELKASKRPHTIYLSEVIIIRKPFYDIWQKDILPTIPSFKFGQKHASKELVDNLKLFNERPMVAYFDPKTTFMIPVISCGRLTPVIIVTRETL
jgi:hypothetical protein